MTSQNASCEFFHQFFECDVARVIDVPVGRFILYGIADSDGKHFRLANRLKPRSPVLDRDTIFWFNVQRLRRFDENLRGRFAFR